MTERTASDAGAIACPFVAFEDDRDERAEQPDHRHRCYAEVRPAPRALAHQEVFCLATGFAACPSFQDWARREAARARRAAASATTTGPAPAPADGLAGLARGSAARAHGDDPADGVDALNAWTGRSAGPGSDLDRPVRNPQRDWAAPPPWIDPGTRGRAEPEAPDSLARPGRSFGDVAAAETTGLAGSRWLQDAAPDGDGDGSLLSGQTPDDADLERSLAEDRAARERSAVAPPSGGPSAAAAPGTFRGRPGGPSGPPPARPTVSDTRRRPIERDAAGPAWERPSRYEAYPTLKTRVGLPSVPRVALAALALLVAAGILFAAPFIIRLVGTGGTGGAAASPTPAAAPTVSPAPTEPPAPTAQVYLVKQGDTMLKIATKFGLSVEELLAANKQIKNPNKIAIGDELNIPAPAPSEIISGGEVPSPSP
jgi:hypothetical protein